MYLSHCLYCHKLINTRIDDLSVEYDENGIPQFVCPRCELDNEEYDYDLE